MNDLNDADDVFLGAGVDEMLGATVVVARNAASLLLWFESDRGLSPAEEGGCFIIKSFSLLLSTDIVRFCCRIGDFGPENVLVVFAPFGENTAFRFAKSVLEFRDRNGRAGVGAGGADELSILAAVGGTAFINADRLEAAAGPELGGAVTGAGGFVFINAANFERASFAAPPVCCMPKTFFFSSLGGVIGLGGTLFGLFSLREGVRLGGPAGLETCSRGASREAGT